MTAKANVKPDGAMSNPEGAFKSPKELVENGALTEAQKITMLERWAFTVRSRMDALSEGMVTQREGSYSHDVELIRDIENCLLRLQKAATGDPAMPLVTEKTKS